MMNKRLTLKKTSEDCPICERKFFDVVVWQFKCPVCNGVFCTACMVTDHKGDGRYVSCPACGTKSRLPRVSKKRELELSM